MSAINPKSDAFPYPSLAVSGSKLVALTSSLEEAGVRYRMGAKANPLSLQAGGFSHIDCSGFVRWALFHATAGALVVPDGSIAQHSWVREQGFKVSSVADGSDLDGLVRIAFLPPDSPLGPGERHVMLLLNGRTLESHGRTQGPSSRVWGSLGFAKYCDVYVLALPSGSWTTSRH